MKCIWPIFVTLSASFLIAGSQSSRAEAVVIDLTRWTPPDINTVGNDPFGKLVKYGHQLFTNAANEIGPSVADASKRPAGNNLSCGNCHLQAEHSPMPCL
jgi:thiosulfate dehydrogenase